MAVLLTLATNLGCSPGPEAPSEDPPPEQKKVDSGDPKIDQLVERLMEALGGQANWDATRFIRFRFAGGRTHHWDRHQGRHRLDFSREGDAYVVLHNVNTRQGSAFKNGQALEGEEAQQLLDRAYRSYINDTYWLVMPYKLLDPGVSLSLDGEEEIEGRIYDKLLLTFDAVGLTPGDRYWAYLNRETGMMDRWAYFLQNYEEGTPPTVWEWSGWERYGKIMLSSGRHNPDRGRDLPLDEIAVFDALDESVFASADPVGSE